jgi:hypothetical protein
MPDLGFQAIGMETLRQYWPVFAAGAAIEIWLIRRVRCSQRFPVRWIASAAIVAAGLAVALWVESFLITQMLYQTVGDGARTSPWEDVQGHIRRSAPPLAGLAIVLVGLVCHPRSAAAIAGLVTAAGLLLSWMVAMWLFVTNHQPVVFRLLVVPGGLGALASVVGFAAATAIWMAIGRWIWREGRRRRQSSQAIEIRRG